MLMVLIKLYIVFFTCQGYFYIINFVNALLFVS